MDPATLTIDAFGVAVAVVTGGSAALYLMVSLLGRWK